jgi:hypothetical protein
MVAGSRQLLTVFEGTSTLRPKMHKHPHISINFYTDIEAKLFLDKRN